MASYASFGAKTCDEISVRVSVLFGENIKEAKICLAMVSKNYKASEVCMNEVGAAWALNNPPIQIVLPGTEFHELGWLLNTNKASKINDIDCLDALGEKLCSSIGILTPTPKHWNPSTRDFLDALQILLKNQEG
jgi:hypothetical protein